MGGRIEVGPGCGDKGATTVGQDQQQAKTSAPMHPAQKLQGLAFERMAWTGDGDLGRETLEVGSVS
jgi:hypothetical protein